jgi:prepilin-type N-terminal cleavage/methylation domain-containing protein
MSMIKNPTQKGFTIVELMIATTVFSVVLLVASSGVINIGKMYYKGINSSATQEVARNLIQELTQDFELSGGFYRKLPQTGGYDGFCIGSHLYTYRIDQKINNSGTGHALVVRDEADCESDSTQVPDDFIINNTQWRELLGPNMRVHLLDIVPDRVDKPQAAKISIKILSGDDDLFNNNLVSPTTGLCKGGIGSQFCANSELTTYAIRRIRVN